VLLGDRLSEAGFHSSRAPIGGRQVATMTFRCQDCGAGVALDGIEPILQWMQIED
jgi:hypothetical protein